MWEKKLMDRVSQVLFNTQRLRRPYSQLHDGGTATNNENHRSPEKKKDENNPPPILTPPLTDDNHRIEKSPTKRKKAKTLPPELPAAFKNRVVETGGRLEDLILVIEKRLYESDVSKGQNRLSLPYGKVNVHEFLTLEERNKLDQPEERIRATLIEPCLRECEIRLRNWKTNSTMALVNQWREVCRRNDLKEGMLIQLWSFRRDSGLCFVLVPID